MLSRLSNSESIWENRYSLQDRSFDIKIPAEPGLFFLGSYDGKESFLNGLYVLSPEDQVEEELKILKKVQKSFQKTEWENLINAIREELKNEIEK